MNLTRVHPGSQLSPIPWQKLEAKQFFIAIFVEGFSCIVKKPNWEALVNSEGADLFPFLQIAWHKHLCVCREES